MRALSSSKASGIRGGTETPSPAFGYCAQFCAARVRAWGLGSGTISMTSALLRLPLCRTSMYSYPNCWAVKASVASFFTEAMGLVSSNGSPLAISRSIFCTCRLLISTRSPPATRARPATWAAPFTSATRSVFHGGLTVGNLGRWVLGTTTRPRMTAPGRSE